MRRKNNKKVRVNPGGRSPALNISMGCRMSTRRWETRERPQGNSPNSRSLQATSQSNERARRFPKLRVEKIKGSSYSPTASFQRIQGQYCHSKIPIYPLQLSKRDKYWRPYSLKVGDDDIDELSMYYRRPPCYALQQPVRVLAYPVVPGEPTENPTLFEAENEDLPMRYERRRYASFWQHQHYQNPLYPLEDLPLHLAGEGFWYDQHNQSIECFECCHPLVPGHPHYQSCSRQSFNVPFNVQNPRPFTTACLCRRTGVTPSLAVLLPSIRRGVRRQPDVDALRSDGYRNRDARLESLQQHLPQHLRQNFADFTDAGFYAINADTVGCFACGKLAGPAQLLPDPFAAHKELSPGCEFMSTLYQGRSSPLDGERYQTGETAPRGICLTCNDNPACIIWEPCRHVVVCETCVSNVTVCPLCQQGVETTRRIFPQ